MAQFAEALARFLNHLLVDMTYAARSAGMQVPPPGAGGMAGRDPAERAFDPSGSSLFTNVQQLGLKLEARKLDLIGIDLEKR